MVLGRNIVTIDLADMNKRILVNSLTGRILLLDNKQADILDQWKDCVYGITRGENEELYDFLLEKGFLYSSYLEEQEIRTQLINRTKECAKPSGEHLTFVLTYGCNFKCPYCYEQDPNTRLPTTILTREMVDAALELHKDELKSINFFGGEPLLPSNIDIIKYIISKCPNLTYTMLTNGYYLADFLPIFDEVQVGYIQVTLDGKKDTNDKTRVLKNGQGSFEAIMKGVALCLKRGIHVKIRMNVSMDNLQECIELREEIIMEYFDSRDLLSFELYPIFQLDDIEKDSAFKHIFGNDLQNYSEHSLGSINHILSSSLPILNYFVMGRKLYPIAHYCDAHISQRLYDPLGDIYSCILGVGNKNCRIGTYFPKHEIFKESMVHRDISAIEQCSQCKYALLCGGGCPLKFCKNGESVMQPNCGQTLYTIHTLIPFVYSIKENQKNSAVDSAHSTD